MTTAERDTQAVNRVAAQQYRPMAWWRSALGAAWWLATSKPAVLVLGLAGALATAATGQWVLCAVNVACLALVELRYPPLDLD